MINPITRLFRSTTRISILLASVWLFSPAISFAQSADADVIKVVATDLGAKGWRFDVTVSHPDTGWQDYVNGWDVLDDQGNVLKRTEADAFSRLLLHPHEHEQPFTRSVSGLKVPESSKTLTVRAHDLKDGFGGKEITLNLSRRSGPGYLINR